MAQAIIRWPLNAEARIRSHSSSCGFYGGQSGIGSSFPPSISVYPVSIIPPTLHTNSLTYHGCSIISAIENVFA